MRYALAILILLSLSLPASAGNPYRLGGTSTHTSANKYSMRSQTGYRTQIHNPYGVRDGDAYKYTWRRTGYRTDIVIYPDYPVQVIKVQEPDHWERARSNYFQQMYGPGGVYSTR